MKTVMNRGDGERQTMTFKRVPSGPVCAKAGLWPYPCSGAVEQQKQGSMRGSFLCGEHAFQAANGVPGFKSKPVAEVVTGETTCDQCDGKGELDSDQEMKNGNRATETVEERYKRLANYWYEQAQEAYRWRDMNADKVARLEVEMAAPKPDPSPQEFPLDELVAVEVAENIANHHANYLVRRTARELLNWRVWNAARKAPSPAHPQTAHLSVLELCLWYPNLAEYIAQVEKELEQLRKAPSIDQNDAYDKGVGAAISFLREWHKRGDYIQTAGFFAGKLAALKLSKATGEVK